MVNNNTTIQELSMVESSFLQRALKNYYNKNSFKFVKKNFFSQVMMTDISLVFLITQDYLFNILDWAFDAISLT